MQHTPLIPYWRYDILFDKYLLAYKIKTQNPTKVNLAGFQVRFCSDKPIFFILNYNLIFHLLEPCQKP